MTKRALPAALLAALLSLASYLAYGDVNLNVVDESYLWYGVQRAAAGEVPMRDFQAYDPARYYWCVSWGWIFGHGILGVRKAAAIFQALGSRQDCTERVGDAVVAAVHEDQLAF